MKKVRLGFLGALVLGALPLLADPECRTCRYENQGGDGIELYCKVAENGEFGGLQCEVITRQTPRGGTIVDCNTSDFCTVLVVEVNP
ncbi:MAG TPA: hypothetical protein VHW00_06145 [Thermoanaerobaculia bacterium]|nr:hypothetical protein [Thermoanaerobaculia bacterium]